MNIARPDPIDLPDLIRYPWWGAEVCTSDIYNPLSPGNAPFSYRGALAAAGMGDRYENMRSHPVVGEGVKPSFAAVTGTRFTFITW